MGWNQNYFSQSQLGLLFYSLDNFSEFQWVYAECLNKLVSSYSGLLNNRFGDLYTDGLPVLDKGMTNTLAVTVFLLPLSSQALHLNVIDLN